LAADEEDSCRGGGPGALERRVAAAMGKACGSHACEEVDLVLVAGEVLTLAGFPPWLTRSSEIYHFAGGLQELSESNLESTLAKYYCTAQRLGA
jgi:undecaprenyl pyrophosphate synthase